MKILIRLFIIIFFCCNTPLPGQGRLEDYQRASKLRELTANKVYRDQVKPGWLTDNTHFWYRVKTGSDTYEFILVNAQEGKRVKAFDHEKNLFN